MTGREEIRDNLFPQAYVILFSLKLNFTYNNNSTNLVKNLEIKFIK